MSNLSIRRYKNVTATPTRFSPCFGSFTGALYDESGRIIVASTRDSSCAAVKHVAEINLPSSVKPRKRLQGKYIYCGHLHGHFLLETLPSLWVLDWVCDDVTLVFHHFSRQGFFEWENIPFIRKLFGYVGVAKRKVQIINFEQIFDDILVPDRLVRINKYISPYASPVYERISKVIGSDIVGGKRIFLSRSEIKHDSRSISFFLDIENLFMRNGFSIVHPEKLEIEDQIKLVSGADFVAGFEGSALHLSLFMRRGACQVVLFNRKNPNIELCNALSGVRTVEIELNEFDESNKSDCIKMIEERISKFDENVLN